MNKNIIPVKLKNEQHFAKDNGFILHPIFDLPEKVSHHVF